MIIKESQLMGNILDQLDQAVYLTQEEAMVQPIAVPVREMNRFGEGATMVHFADVERLAEDSQVSYMEAMATIAEANQIDASLMTVAIDEAEIIENPEIVYEMQNVSVIPISHNDPVYQFCEMAADKFLEQGNEAELDAILTEGIGEIVQKVRDQKAKQAGAPAPAPKLVTPPQTPVKESVDSWMRDKTNYYRGYKAADTLGDAIKDVDWAINTNRKFDEKYGTFGKIPKAVVANAKTTIQGLGKTYEQFKDRPRNVIAKKIASLRLLYGKWMKKAQIEKNAGVASLFKRGAHKVMTIIDKLLRLLQQKANSFSK